METIKKKKVALLSDFQQQKNMYKEHTQHRNYNTHPIQG